MANTKNIIRKATALAVAATAALALTACSSNTGGSTSSSSNTAGSTSGSFVAPGDSDKGGKNNPVTIGVVGASGEQFQYLTTAAQAEGIYIKFQDFTDYSQPNPALASGQLDLNQFQHIIYLAQYNVAENQDLVPIGSTAIYPLGLYSSQYKSVADIPQGATITVPDDVTNQSRGLNVLQSAGLIKLKDGTPTLSASVADIDTANSKVKVNAIAADQTPRSLDDKSIAAAIVNNDYLADSGLQPENAIAQDDPNSAGAKPFINIWVSQNKDKDNPVFAEIIRLAHTDGWNQALQKNSNNTAVLVNDTPAELQAVLADVTSQLKNA